MDIKNSFSGVIVITPEKFYLGEKEVISHITSRGSYVHLRKPNSYFDQFRDYSEQIAKECNQQKNISVHYNPEIADIYNFGGVHIRYNQRNELRDYNLDSNIRLSCSTHSFSEALDAENSQFSYYFLSPIFDSISKTGYKSNFTLNDLSLFLKSARKCVALGGVNSENVKTLNNFYSIALLGTVWVIKDNKIDIDSSINRFEKIEKLWRELKGCNI